jgi:hypothetical protein
MSLRLSAKETGSTEANRNQEKAREYCPNRF